ncbi:hypothetical protein FGB62_54g18 [Gracilaria domingensis]|nr:hypothetical protein FGB62_54g18 [Gracilaria domingensis]
MRNTLHLTAPHVSEIVIKKSRFVTSASKAGTIAEAKAFIELVREPRASHNCWAYRIGESIYRFNDDGEPSGTAGRPIYSAICASDVDQVVVVVTRYFGGVKLGASGLIRAYNRAAVDCLKGAPKEIAAITVDLEVSVPWEHIGVVQAIADGYERLDAIYSDSGCTILLRVALDVEKAVQEKIINVTGGSAKIERLSSDESNPTNNI